MSSSYAGNTSNGLDKTITIPSDGDDRDASSVNTALEAMQDSIVWLAEERFSAQYSIDDTDGSAVLATDGSGATSSTFVDLGLTYYETVTGLKAGAIILIDVGGSLQYAGAGSASCLGAIRLVENPASAPAEVDGTIRGIKSDMSAPFHIAAMFTATGSEHTFGLQGAADVLGSSGTDGTLHILDEISWRTLVLRTAS